MGSTAERHHATRISGIVITLNEENRIRGAIRSLSCCDEVVVVDSGSTDRTCAIAESLGARVIPRPWSGYSEQKNFAASQASHDWVLSIDADEEVSAELAGAISRLRLNGFDDACGYQIARRANYLGTWIDHSGWYPDWKTRLYDRRKARWQGDLHESVVADGRLGRLTGDLLHFPYRSVRDHYERIDRYTRLAAESARRSGRRGRPLKLIFGPGLQFLRSFVIQLGFLDGAAGLRIAWMSAHYVFLREFRILRSDGNGSRPAVGTGHR